MISICTFFLCHSEQCFAGYTTI